MRLPEVKINPHYIAMASLTLGGYVKLSAQQDSPDSFGDVICKSCVVAGAAFVTINAMIFAYNRHVYRQRNASPILPIVSKNNYPNAPAA